MLEIRTHPERYWRGLGEVSKNVGTFHDWVVDHPPWISEMYGYVFGAGRLNVTHTLTRGVIEYNSGALHIQKGSVRECAVSPAGFKLGYMTTEPLRSKSGKIRTKL